MKNIIIALVFFCGTAFGQDLPIVEFENSNHDFGTIKEENGPVIHDFIFVNKGKAPLIISRVKPSCGCTTPSWTKEPVMPGEKGIIKAQYNPRNRPGSFRKSLTVTTNAEPVVTRLYINGTVIPKPKTIEEEYSLKLGKLRFRTKSIQLGRMNTEKSKEHIIEVYNDSDEVISFKEAVTAPDFIKIKFDSMALLPKSVRKIMLTYDPVHEDNLGFNSHSIYIETNETVDARKELHIMASIVEFFPPMTEVEMKNAPKLNIADRLFDFGKMTLGNSYETKFVLTNNGNSKLNIRKIKSNCACLIATIDKYDLKPGKSIELKVKFDTNGRKGNQIKNVTIYSNDPSDPTQIVTIKGSVSTN